MEFKPLAPAAAADAHAPAGVTRPANVNPKTGQPYKPGERLAALARKYADESPPQASRPCGPAALPGCVDGAPWAEARRAVRPSPPRSDPLDIPRRRDYSDLVEQALGRLRLG
jgi:hypothetical protein